MKRNATTIEVLTWEVKMTTAHTNDVPRRTYIEKWIPSTVWGTFDTVTAARNALRLASQDMVTARNRMGVYRIRKNDGTVWHSTYMINMPGGPSFRCHTCQHVG